MTVVYSDIYNGLVAVLSGSMAIFLIGLFVVLFKQLGRCRSNLWLATVIALVTDASIKSLFYNHFYWRSGAPWWVTPICDAAVFGLFIWTAITIWRLKVKG